MRDENLIFKKSFYKGLIFFIGSAFILLFGFKNSAQDPQEKVHFCFFELDNTTTSDNLMKKDLENVEIHRYGIQKGGSRKTKGKKAFEKMIQEMSQQGKKCDSLVISGHHAGDWFGETGILWLKDMEALACKKEYQGWFQNIKALWLDGCNTVTDDFIKSWDGGPGVKKNPDSATVRYFKDHTKLDKQDMEVYQQSYSGSLDEYSPLSSRYLRMFPNTQIYGANGSAPTGEQAGSQSFIFQHLSNLGQALKAEESALEDRATFDKGLQALFTDDPCSEESLEAWESINQQANWKAVENQDYKKAKKLGCDLILAKQVLDDPSSPEAQKALAKQILEDSQYKNTKALRIANEILNSEGDPSKKAIQLAKLSIVQTLKKINEEDQDIKEGRHKYSHLLFNNLYDTWRTAKKYKDKDNKFFKAVQSEFQKETFSQSVEEKIKSPITASLRKADYVKFYTEVHNVNIKGEDAKARFVKTHIKNLLNKAHAVFEGSIRGNPGPKRALAVSVADQLLQYDLLDRRQMERLLKNQKLFPSNTKNPFIKDTWTKLKFTLNPQQIIPTIQKEPEGSLSRKSAIRVGTSFYLDQVEEDRDAKDNLAELVKPLYNTNQKRINKEDDIQVFFQTLDMKFKGRSEEDKANILLKMSSQTSPGLEKLLVSYYANHNLKDPSVRTAFCQQLKRERGEKKRGGFIIAKKDDQGQWLPGCQ